MLALIIPRTALATSVLLQHAPQSVTGMQQFYVDVAISADRDAFNGIQGEVHFSSANLEFVRAETGTSIVSYFIDQPKADGNTISFSGIIVGGFGGLINPFDQGKRFPGQILRLVFQAKKPGTASIFTKNITVTKNDGQGTLSSVDDARVSLAVVAGKNNTAYSFEDTVAPTITASVVYEKDLNDGKPTLIFSAIDKQSGIDHVELQGKNGSWKTIESPYLLQNYSGKGILSVRAYDVAGNVALTTVGTAATHAVGAALLLAAIAILILYVIYKKSKHKKHVF
ncbi:MAG: hypothetical protein V4478_04295 [Patescibacteria group bacterium]